MADVTNTVKKRYLFGRKLIQTDEKSITKENIAKVLNDALNTHRVNSGEIDYLYSYYRGKQSILSKVKEIRPEINNQVVENRANEIVTFKLGYTFGEPVQYIRHGEEENTTKALETLNENMFMAEKASNDTDIAEWFFICGVGYRMVYPTKPTDEDYEDTSFNLSSPDPRRTFIVYSNEIKPRRLMGVTYVTRESDNKEIYTCYTKDKIYTISDIVSYADVSEENNPLGDIPIVEYRLNNAMMGAFEPVLTLLDALNETQSNRMDDVVQYVNSFLALLGAELDENGYQKLNEWKMLMLPEGTDAKYLSSPMQQSDIQQLKEDLYQSILTICGMPNRNGGSSTSDTGAAVQLRDGWETAEAQAKSVEKMFKKSEKQFLRMALKILKTKEDIDLKLSQIEIKFARRYTDNILTKTQALSQLLDAGISPEIAIATSGIWNDPTDVYIQSKESLDARWSLEDPEETKVEDNNDVLSTDGTGAEETQETKQGTVS